MGITAREHQVLSAVARGDSHAKIAADLGISVKTVKDDHARKIREHYHARTTEEAVAIAVTCGDLRRPSSYRHSRLDALEELVLRELANGALAKTIVRKYKLSDRKVARVIRKILDKLGARTREHAVWLGFGCGYITAHDGNNPRRIPRERRVDLLFALTLHDDIKAIARSQHVSPQYVRVQLNRLQRELGAKSWPHAMAIAILEKRLVCLPSAERIVPLNRREQIVLLAIASGMVEREIVKTSGLSAEEIERLTGVIQRKLRALNEVHMVYIAYQHGLLS